MSRDQGDGQGGGRGELLEGNILPNERKLTDHHFLNSASVSGVKLCIACMLNELSKLHLKTGGRRSVLAKVTKLVKGKAGF